MCTHHLIGSYTLGKCTVYFFERKQGWKIKKAGKHIQVNAVVSGGWGELQHVIIVGRNAHG